MKFEFLKTLRSCPWCASGFGGAEFFCPTCWEALGKYRADAEIQDYHFPVYSVFDWRSSPAGPMISLLLEAQKGDKNERYLRGLCLDLIRLRLSSKALGENSVLVPAPMRKDRVGANHALRLANLIGVSMGLPVEDVLLDETKGEQKEKSAKDRSAKSLRSRAHLDRVIFVDDVITSGGTAAAAKRALGANGSFEVWTLACRRLATLI